MNKKILFIGLGAVVLFVLVKGKSNSPSITQGYEVAGEPSYRNDTLYIPTTSYDVKVNEGTITNNVDNSSQDQVVGNNSTVTNPPPPVLSGVVDTKPPTITTTTPTVTTPTTTTKPTTTTTTTKATYKNYTVKKGDTLWKLSGGTNAKLQALLKINPQITNPNLIKVGQVIKIPV